MSLITSNSARRVRVFALALCAGVTLGCGAPPTDDAGSTDDALAADATTAAPPDTAIELTGAADAATGPDSTHADSDGPEDLLDADTPPDAAEDPAESDGLCEVAPGAMTWCPVRLVRATTNTPPAVGLDLLLWLDGARFVGAATFSCGSSDCPPDFTPPSVMPYGHHVTLSPPAPDLWSTAGTVAVHGDPGAALAATVAPDAPEPVLWLAFESDSPTTVRLVSAVPQAPPGASLTATHQGSGVLWLAGGGPGPECLSGAAPSTCDDGVACTADACVAAQCVHALDPDVCLIEGVCVAGGAVRPENSCESCQPEQFTNAWSARQGEPCDDEDACTESSVCVKANCVGQPVSCDDNNPCTADACDPLVGCTHVDSGACDDPCDIDPTLAGCGCVVGRAIPVGCGAVFIWGDEHVTHSSYGEAPRPFWAQAAAWLKTAGGCGITRERIAFKVALSAAAKAGVEDALLAVVSDGTEQVRVVPSTAALDPAALTEWVKAGGALMMTIVGTGAPNAECDAANAALAGLGVGYDCTVAAPWGPVALPSPHPILQGLTVENVPFVNGRWVTAAPGTPSGVVARVQAPTCPP